MNFAKINGGLKALYYHKWFPRFFFKKFDGGIKSGVTGYFLVEFKPLFSVGLLHFAPGSREASHSHAFNAVTWWLSGGVQEIQLCGRTHNYYPSLWPKITKRTCFHKVFAYTSTWAFTIRGPWNDTWKEFSEGEMITLTHGRNQVKSADSH